MTEHDERPMDLRTADVLIEQATDLEKRARELRRLAAKLRHPNARAAAKSS